MKILEKSFTKDGVEIQLEEWYGKLAIGAYPKAKNSVGFIKYDELFRLTISENIYRGYTKNDVKKDFEVLKKGEKQLKDLSHLFWNGKKDCILLGIQ